MRKRYLKREASEAAPSHLSRLRRWLRGQIRCRQEGAALLSVVVVIAVIATMAADFAYNSEVDLAAAANARDDLRAHYLARSGMNLSRLLLRVQERFIEPNRQFFGGMDLQIADYAPVLISAFNNR
jgi:transposase